MFRTALFISLLLVPALALADSAEKSRMELQFKKANKDNDGTLTKEEAKAIPYVHSHFDAMDADKDGTVTLEEIHNYMKSRREQKQSAKPQSN